MNSEKLRKLAHHLRTGPLFHKWNFTRFRAVRLSDTCGCAVGELAELFEHDLLNHYLDEYAQQIDGYNLSSMTLTRIERATQELLDLTHKEFEYLFVPVTDADQGSRWLTEQATPEQVAALIEHYVQHRYMLCRSEEDLQRLKIDEDATVSNYVNPHA